MKNNFIYHNGEIEFSQKSSWSLVHNYFYNTYNLSEIYSDSTSKSAQTLDINGIFNNIGSFNYFDENVSVEYLHQSKNHGYFKLVNSRKAKSVTTDFLGCQRNTKTPKVGVF